MRDMAEADFRTKNEEAEQQRHCAQLASPTIPTITTTSTSTRSDSEDMSTTAGRGSQPEMTSLPTKPAPAAVVWQYPTTIRPSFPDTKKLSTSSSTSSPSTPTRSSASLTLNEADSYTEKTYIAMSDEGGILGRAVDPAPPPPAIPPSGPTPSPHSGGASVGGAHAGSKECGKQYSHRHHHHHTSRSYTRRITMPAAGHAHDGYILNDSTASGAPSAESHAPRLLIYLSVLAPFVSLAASAWTSLVLLFLLLVATPLRVCTTQRPLSAQIIAFLSPLHHQQLRLIYSSVHRGRHSGNRRGGGRGGLEAGPATAEASPYSARRLVLVHLSSPFISAAIAVAAWVSAFFWLYAAILGNPDGRDGKNDGRAAVMGVHRWWLDVLCQAFRE